MKTTCEFAQGDEFNRIVCGVTDKKLLCTCQRYCTMENEWQNTDKVSQCERRKTYMSNKGYSNEKKSFEVQTANIEETPIEVAPIAEEIKEDIKEIPITRPEVKSASRIKKEAPKQQARVILITRNSCIARTLAEPQHNIDFYGPEYMSKQIGDIIEF